MSRVDDRLHWGKATVETACVLDCPDSCTLSVSIEEGRVVKVDGSPRNPVTAGYICAKVRRFADHLYGPDRLKYPAVRTGPKGKGLFKRVSWDEALGLIAKRLDATKRTWGAEAILPFCYGGSNGLLSQDTTDAELFRRLGTSRLARTVCAAPTGAAALGMYGKMPGVAYQDYPAARLIVIWGANPSTSGLHLVPFVREAQRRGAKLVVVDPRRTQLARLSDLHLPIRPGTDLPVAMSVIGHLFAIGQADQTFLNEHTTGADELREKAAEWSFERAAAIAGIDRERLAQFASIYAELSPAVIRCGWGLERNRNGGHAVMAVLALPAVAGKFGVRGGGYTMSNSTAFGLTANSWIGAPEAPARIINMNLLGRSLAEPLDPPIKFLFVYNCNPVATMPEQRLVEQGLQRDDLFTVVFDQVMTDTAAYADVVLPATTFLETYDIAKGYGSMTLQLAKPVIDVVGESRPNTEVFSELAQRLGVGEEGATPESEGEVLLRVTGKLPTELRDTLFDGEWPEPPGTATPVQFVDVHPRTPDRKAHLMPNDVETSAPEGLYSYRPDPGTDEFPLALLSPASDKTISSTLGQLRQGFASLYMHSEDALARGIEDGEAVRVFNQRGEVQCLVKVGLDITPGTVSLPKGLWKKSTLNRVTANALCPDTLADLGGGACFNDARVQVARMVTATFEQLDLSLWVAH